MLKVASCVEEALKECLSGIIMKLFDWLLLLDQLVHSSVPLPAPKTCHQKRPPVPSGPKYTEWVDSHAVFQRIGESFRRPRQVTSSRWRSVPPSSASMQQFPCTTDWASSWAGRPEADSLRLRGAFLYLKPSQCWPVRRLCQPSPTASGVWEGPSGNNKWGISEGNPSKSLP